MADQKKEIGERDLETIVADEIYIVPETYKIDNIEVTSGTSQKPMARVRLIFAGKPIEATETGVGPVDAVYRAIDRITRTPTTLVDYSIQAITGGTDAQGEVTVRIKEGDLVYVGHGAAMDIIVASAKAYLAAVNRLLFSRAENLARGLD